MNYIDVTIKGYVIYAENENHEMYDFFIPSNDYRMTKRQALRHIPVSHTLLAYRRDTKILNVKFEELQKISN